MNFVFSKPILVLLIVFCGGFLKAQNAFTDSLKKELKKNMHDTARCLLLNTLVEAENDEKIWPKYNEQLLQLANKNLTKKNPEKVKRAYLTYKAKALNNKGLIYSYEGNTQLSIQCYKESLQIQKALNNQYDIAQVLNNIGGLYMSIENFTDALKYQLESVKINTQIKDTVGLSRNYNNIGSIYDRSKQRDKGIQYHLKALQLRTLSNDLYGIANSLNNIGNTLIDLGKQSSNEKNKLYYLDSALNCFNNAIKIQQQTHDYRGYAHSLNNISSIYFALNKLNMAVSSQEMAHNEALKLGHPEIIETTAKLLSFLYEKTGKHKEALSLFKLHLTMRDSILNDQTKKASIRERLQYEYDKKVTADNLKREQEKKIEAARLEYEKNLQYVFLGGMFLTLIFGVFMFNRFRVTQRQKKIIEEQKQMVEQKQKEVTDSILYAKRIQQALLPTEQYIRKSLDKTK